MISDRSVVLSVRGVSKVFGSKDRRVAALGSVDLDVYKGEFLSLIGTSGCGKTTLLRIIDGLEEADSGQILLEEKELVGVSRDMGYVFQGINLLPWRSVIQNVEIGLEARGIEKHERRARALAALDMVGLSHAANFAPYTLSGGMQQRVGVARAIAVAPKVLLMDEPFGQLDNFTREALQVEIADLWARLGMTIVFVTHDVDEALFLSDRVALFQSSPGRIIEVIDVDLPRPRKDDFRALPGAISLRARIMDHLRSPNSKVS